MQATNKQSCGEEEPTILYVLYSVLSISVETIIQGRGSSPGTPCRGRSHQTTSPHLSGYVTPPASSSLYYLLLIPSPPYVLSVLPSPLTLVVALPHASPLHMVLLTVVASPDAHDSLWVAIPAVCTTTIGY